MNTGVHGIVPVFGVPAVSHDVIALIIMTQIRFIMTGTSLVKCATPHQFTKGFVAPAGRLSVRESAVPLLVRRRGSAWAVTSVRGVWGGESLKPSPVQLRKPQEAPGDDVMNFILEMFSIFMLWPRESSSM